jgi:hypothetical protein
MDRRRRINEIGALRHVAENVYHALTYGGDEHAGVLFENEKEELRALHDKINQRAENMAKELYEWRS